jgi:hypothetical protein
LLSVAEIVSQLIIPLPENQIEFEKSVMESVMRKNPTVAHIIAEQYRTATVSDRYGTGAGCYVNFDVPEDAPKLPDETEYPLSGELYVIDGLPNVVNDKDGNLLQPDNSNSVLCGAFVIHNQRGLITYLDCHTYGSGLWPTDQYVYSFTELRESN